MSAAAAAGLAAAALAAAGVGAALGSSRGDRAAGTTAAPGHPGGTLARASSGTPAAPISHAVGPARRSADRAPREALAGPVSAARPLTVRRAYAGVSCRRANRIGCDRIGVAVWLRHGGFARVTARVGGRVIVLRRGGDGLWSGHLAQAGLRAGPLRVPARDGRWIGFDAPIVRAAIDATRSDGGHAATVVATPLRAGWG